MDIKTSLELTEKYLNCPECGNQFIGNGEGGIIVEDTTFDRWCKCGWKVHVEINDKQSN